MRLKKEESSTKSKESVLPPWNIRIETELSVSVYEWTSEFEKWARKELCIDDDLQGLTLGCWPQIRENPQLLQAFVRRALCSQTNTNDCDWNAVMEPEPMSLQEISSCLLGDISIEQLRLLDSCVIISYTKATLFAPDKNHNIDLRNIEDLSSSLPNPTFSFVLYEFPARITTHIQQTLDGSPSFFFTHPSYRHRLLLLWQLVESMPEILEIWRTPDALGDIYEEVGCSDNPYGLVLDAFISNESESYRPSEDRATLAPAISKLPPSDAAWFHSLPDDTFGWEVSGFIHGMLKARPNGRPLLTVPVI
jgi:hypothetical protein